jgi:tetratricopeptide (TPR) repeat protein
LFIVETADELDRRARQCDGWIAPQNIDVLIEYGYVRDVERLAEEGDWFCARAIAARRVEQGRYQAALALLTPYSDTGWWTAVREIAQLLERSDQTGAAIDLVLPYAETGDRAALAYAAGLLARCGRVDDAFAMLRPRLGDPFHARTLVTISAGLGRDEEVVKVLGAAAAAAPARDRWHAADLCASVLERMGRVEEAVALLRERARVRNVTYVNLVEHLADLLARHGRAEELRALTDSYGGEHAAFRLARYLESVGDLDGAVALLEPIAASGRPNPSVVLAELLLSSGRTDEALASLRRALVGGEEDWLINTWAQLMAGAGRADEAMAVLDELADGPFGMTWELFEQRVGLLAASGRAEQAIDELRAHPRSGEWYAAWYLAELLTDEGRAEEALAVLESSPEHAMSADLRARLLISQGRADEAIAMLRQPKHVLPEPWL